MPPAVSYVAKHVSYNLGISICESFTCKTFVDDLFVKDFPVKLLPYMVFLRIPSAIKISKTYLIISTYNSLIPKLNTT